MTRRGLIVALCLAALACAAPGPARAQTPGELVVALSMPTPGFQVGVVRGREVLLARGYEVDLARAVAARLGYATVRFVNEARFTALFSSGAKEGRGTGRSPSPSGARRRSTSRARTSSPTRACSCAAA